MNVTIESTTTHRKKRKTNEIMNADSAKETMNAFVTLDHMYQIFMNTSLDALRGKLISYLQQCGFIACPEKSSHNVILIKTLIEQHWIIIYTDYQEALSIYYYSNALGHIMRIWAKTDLVNLYDKFILTERFSKEAAAKVFKCIDHKIVNVILECAFKCTGKKFFENVILHQLLVRIANKTYLTTNILPQNRIPGHFWGTCEDIMNTFKIAQFFL